MFNFAVDARLNQRASYKSWLICLSAGSFFLYAFFQLNVFDVINHSLRTDFQLNAAQLSWLSSSYLWAELIFLLPAGIILDYVSARLIILIAMSLCIMGTLGFSVTNSFPLACIFRFLVGLGSAFSFLSCAILTYRWFTPNRQAVVFGILVTLAFIGAIIAHTPFAYLSEFYGWRLAMVINSCIGIILWLWIYFIVQDKKSHQLSVPLQHGKLVTSDVNLNFSQVCNNLQNWLAGSYTCCLNLPIMVLGALWGSSYLQVVHHLSAIAASNVISLIFVGCALGSPLAGLISDWHGQRKPTMLWGALLTLLALIPFLMHCNLNQSELSCLFLAIGLFSSTQVISYPLIAESNNIKNTGTATGLASVIIMGGGGIAQILFGWLMQYHTKLNMVLAYSVADYKFALWMFPFAIFIAIIAVLLLREP